MKLQNHIKLAKMVNALHFYSIIIIYLEVYILLAFKDLFFVLANENAQCLCVCVCAIHIMF